VAAQEKQKILKNKSWLHRRKHNDDTKQDAYYLLYKKLFIGNIIAVCVLSKNVAITLITTEL